jgi:predicted extracellular nuclease
LQELNDRRRLLVDDGSATENPATIPYLAPDNTLRLGDTVAGLTGVLGYDYGVYRLHPTITPTFVRENPRTSVPGDVGGTFKVASFNVLNYFTTIDDGSNEARGADSAAEFVRQRDKIINAILALDADVIGLMEIENNGSVAISDLVAGLNDASGPGTYAYIPDPAIGLGDYPIKVAIIFRPAFATPVGAVMTDTDPIFDRPPVAQTFVAYGETFSVVVNHFKSKGCSGASGLDLDQGDGQGCYNYKRTLQAQQLLVFIEGIKSESGDDDVLVIGDLNAYGQEDPVLALTGGSLTNHVANHVSLAERYSYVYFGQAGYLDHALSTSSLDDRITGVDIWHINSDEPRILDYNTEFNPSDLYSPDMYRSSDHDPVIVGVCEGVPPEIDITLTPKILQPPNHKYVEVTATVSVTDNIDSGIIPWLLSVTSNELDNELGDGNMPNDILIYDDFTFELRAERSGPGEIRVYTFTYMATDSCGNSSAATATVIVPKSNKPTRINRFDAIW